MKGKDLTGPVLAIALAIALIGAGSAYLLSRDQMEDTKEEPVELGPLTQRLSSLTSTTVSGMGSSSNDEVRDEIVSMIAGWVDTSQNMVPGHSVVLLSSDVMVTSSEMTAEIPIPASNIESEKGTITPNSLMFGNSGSLPLVPSVRTDVELEIQLTPNEGGDRRIMELSYSQETVDMERSLIRILDLLENDVNGWSSGLARDIEYMLNSLVRLRANSDVGTHFTDTNFHLLNEGDVELAFNFAIAIRLARWTGTIPSGLVSNIDSYFSSQSHALLMNPTGARPWTESEKENFEDYIVRTKGETVRRKAADLLSIITSFEHADPADLFIRYLYMDRSSGSLGRKEPLDLISPLEEDQTIDPRQPTDTTDPYSLEHHPSFPSSDGIVVSNDELLIEGEEISFKPTFGTDYMVVGRDLQVRGVNTFKAWYTNANLSLTDEQLVAYGPNISITRCGAVPPPPKPPTRDFRVQWDLDISGSMVIDAETTGWSGNTYDPSSISRSINLSIPVRIHAGTGSLYDEGFPGLYNINTGIAFTSYISGGWVITPEANATEYFTSKVWPELKGALSSLTSLARSSGWFEGVLEPSSTRQTIQTLSIGTLSSLGLWMENTEVQTKLYVLYNNKIGSPGIDINDVGPIMLDGHVVSISYSPPRDRMEITSNLPEGQLSIMIWPISGGEMKVTAQVVNDAGTRIELDLDERSFSIHGRFDDQEINEGSLIPRSPEKGLWNMMGQGTFISSPTVAIQRNGVLSPYVTENDIPDTDIGEVLLSVTLTGEELEEDIMDELPDLMDDDILSLFRSSVPIAEKYGLSIGLSLSYSGESIPLIGRSMVFSSLTKDDLLSIGCSGEIERALMNMITSARLSIPNILGEEIMITETTPLWTIQISGVSSTDHITTAIHISPLGTVSFSYFSGRFEPMERPFWTQVEENDLTPLW